MIDAKIFQLLRRVFGFISNNPFCFCVILGAAYFLYWLVSNGLLYGADTSNKVAGIFTPLIVGGVTAYVAWNQYKLAQRQHELAREQKSLTERQANIAEQQAQTAKENKEIAHNKLRMEQFEKRYGIYSEILEFALFSSDMSSSIRDYMLKFNVNFKDSLLMIKYEINFESLEKYNDCKKEFFNTEAIFNDMKTQSYRKIVQATFLYNTEIFQYMDDFHKRICQLGLRKISVIKQQIEKNNFYEPYKVSSRVTSVKSLQEEIIKEATEILPKKLKDYLDISNI